MSVDTLGLALALVGAWRLARAAIDWKRFGKAHGTAIDWLLLLVGMAFPFVFGEHSRPAAAALALRNLGGGLLLAGVWQALESTPARVRLVTGALGLLGWWSEGRWWGLPEPLPASNAVVELLLELGPDDQLNEVVVVLAEFDATAERAFPTVDLVEDEDLAQVYLVRVAADRSAGLVAALRADAANVDVVEPNAPVELEPDLPGAWAMGVAAATNDPLAPSQWSLEAAGVNDLLRYLKDKKPSRVANLAIVDTGVDSRHEDLAAVWGGGPGALDQQGHGSHCAGIAAASSNNGLGMASPNLDGRFVTVLGYAALGADGRGTSESIAQAIIDATDGGADVISLSLGGHHPTPPDVEVDAIRYALKRRVIVVAAAGNDHGEDARETAPANVPGVIVVGATQRDGRIAPFSNVTTSLPMPIAAPGADIVSVQTNGQYVASSGTSMATPLVAGILGVMRSLKPKLTANDAYFALRTTAVAGPDAEKIGPTVQAGAAIRAIVGR